MTKIYHFSITTSPARGECRRGRGKKTSKMSTIKVKASTVLSFVTGRLYSTTAPTDLFQEMLCTATGMSAVYTHQLPQLMDLLSKSILSQCDSDFQDICRNWKHTEDWPKRVQLIDEIFGSFDIGKCEQPTP